MFGCSSRDHNGSCGDYCAPNDMSCNNYMWQQPINLGGPTVAPTSFSGQEVSMPAATAEVASATCEATNVQKADEGVGRGPGGPPHSSVQSCPANS